MREPTGIRAQMDGLDTTNRVVAVENCTFDFGNGMNLMAIIYDDGRVVVDWQEVERRALMQAIGPDLTPLWAKIMIAIRDGKAGEMAWPKDCPYR